MKFVQSASVGGFARELARAQLNSLLAFKREFAGATSEGDRENQYVLALAMRPGYTVEEVEKIVAIAKMVNKSVNFQSVVHSLAIHEYHKITGDKYLTAQDSAKMLKAIAVVIPAHL